MWFVDAFRDNPELAVFLTLALGAMVGRFSVKNVGLGAVTGTLLVGLLVGQMRVDVPDLVKTIAFVGFLFTLGYQVGAQFVGGLRRKGVSQPIVAVVGCVTGLAVVYLLARVLGYGPGLGAGLLAGGLTQSAAIGVATAAIDGSAGLSADQKHRLVQQIPVAYTICYLFGLAAGGFFLSQIAPRLLGTRDLRGEAAALERSLGTFPVAGAAERHQAVIVRRAYRVAAGSNLDGATVGDEEARAARHGRRIFLQRYRRDGVAAFTRPDTRLRAGDIVMVVASRADLIDGYLADAGTEVNDPDLLTYDLESVPVVVTRNRLHGATIDELAGYDLARNLFVKQVVRAGVPIPFGPQTTLQRGDELTIEGPRELVERAVKEIGRPNRSGDATDFSYIGSGIVLGGLVGVPVLTIAGVSVGLTTGGGALLMGLAFGWLRSRVPIFGNFPAPAQWLLETGGPCLFVGVVGIQSGPYFLAGIRQDGLSLVAAGLVVTLVPMLVTLTIGRYVCRWPTVVNLGVTTGAFTMTASISAITATANSRVPVLYYTVPYAIGNVLLTMWGAVIVALLS